MRNKKGFTLLELIIVVIVIGILASIALPRYMRIAEKGRVAEAKSILGAIRSAQIRYGAQYNNFTTDLTRLDIDSQTKYFSFQPPVTGESVANNTAIVGWAIRNTSVDMAPGINAYNISITAAGNLTINTSDTFLL